MTDLPRQGEVWWAEAEDKRRPVLVVTRNEAIRGPEPVVVAPVTRTVGIPTEVPLGPPKASATTARRPSTTSSRSPAISSPSGRRTPRDHAATSLRRPRRARGLLRLGACSSLSRPPRSNPTRPAALASTP